MKIKTSELNGSALNWMVATCEGKQPRIVAGWVSVGDVYFLPTTNWAQGGPIIEREEIELTLESPGMWRATIDLMEGDVMVESQCGPTPLIAAMRCFVTSRLGNEVDVPEELL